MGGGVTRREPAVKRLLGREELLRLIDEVGNERDVIYAGTVNPRRNVRRAIDALGMGNVVEAERFLRAAKADLDGVAEAYQRWMAQP